MSTWWINNAIKDKNLDGKERMGYACDTNKLNKILWFRKNFSTHSIKLMKIGRFPKSDKVSLTFLFFCLGYVSLSCTLNQFWSFSPKFLWAEYQFKIPSGSIRLVAIPVWKNIFPDQSHGKRTSFQRVLFWTKSAFCC